MPVLIASKHERFAQFVSKGLSAVDAYIAAGYSKSNARSNASRLSANDSILARIKELQLVVSERVVAAEVRRRSWRVQVLQAPFVARPGFARSRRQDARFERPV